MKEENLIFIISQPRSGSTYLQNLLSNNKETNTCSEPWILLNFANQIKPELLQAKFDNNLAVNAYEDYLSKYPDFDFKENQKQFLLSLYNPMFNGFNFVIDKTPRYWEILKDIVRLFPKSKVIILKRNPTDVLKSIIRTWDITTLKKMHYYKRDILYAPKQIHSFCIAQENNKNVYSLRYEDLIKETAKEIQKIYEWIGIDYNVSVLETSSNKKYKGKYGDPFQNSNNDAVLEKEKSNKKEIPKVFQDFIVGYNHYLERDFLVEYGDYQLKQKEYKKTDAFKYFMHIKESDNNGFNKDFVQLLKVYYLKFKLYKFN